MEETTNPLPPVDDPSSDPNWVPPIVHEPAPGPAPVHHNHRDVEITRIPSPTVVAGRVVFPEAHGVDYTVDDKAVTGAQTLSGQLKVKARAKNGYKFATGLKQTFNLEG